jgi:predicted nucleic acid-binding protein
MPDRVVDASVLVALAFGEPRAAEARELINGATLHAPSILLYELCSAAWQKTRRHPDRAETMASSLRLALAADVALQPVPPRELLSLAVETGLIVYDASYLWVARDLGCELLTFDARLARAARAI